MEGYLLAHCIGTKDADEFGKAHRVFSLRDKLGVSHCTVLLQRDNTWSPYGGSRDLLTNSPMTLGKDKYFVLQVRGREDELARWEYYWMVLQWYLAHGGKCNVQYGKLQQAVEHVQDSDLKYHYGYALDESVNMFNWAYHHRPKRSLFRKLGWSL
jgi:hypothetical protein